MCSHKIGACLAYMRYIKGANAAGVERARGKVVGEELGR